MAAEFIFLAFFGLLAWFVIDSLRSREIAIAAAREFCARKNLQFLDGAVASIYIRPSRYEGQLTLARRFRFEFSDTGNNRLSGTIFMQGREVVSMHVEAFMTDDHIGIQSLPSAVDNDTTL